MRRWTAAERDLLFRAHPPTGKNPTTPEFERIARELDRTLDSVRSQWHRARSIVLGNGTVGSQPLRDYLARRGWL
jgi:hypothetical protein